MGSAPTLMTTAQLAERLHLRPQTLRKWRIAGHGPRWIRLSPGRGRIVYSLRDVEIWLASRAHRSTSEEQPGGEDRGR